MNELRRILLVALSLVLACAVFRLAFGARLPGQLNLHKWYWGCVAIFLPLLMAMMVITLRGRLERAIWPIVVGTVIGWVASSLAYLIYFGLFEGFFTGAVRVHRLIDTVFIVMVFPPAATFSPLLGALAGAFFALSRYLLLRSGSAKPLGVRA